METKVTRVSSVEYELEISADKDALEGRIMKSLKRAGSQVKMKGFRAGKVPVQMLKKMYGDSVAYTEADRIIQEVYDEEIVRSDEHEVLGRPIVKLVEYEPFGDLKAVVRFGVRPEIVIEDLSGKQLERLTRETSSEEVDEEIQKILKANADLVPHDGPAGEDDHVTVEMQRIGEDGEPVEGETQQAMPIHLGNEQLIAELRDGLVGASADETRRIDLPPDPNVQGEDGEPIPRVYDIKVLDVKKSEIPELTDELVHELTKERLSTVAELREDVERQLKESWEQASREDLESKMINLMRETHPIPVPSSVVEAYLDGFIADMKKRGEEQGQAFPEDFDDEEFREANREGAEELTRWLLLRDQVMENQGLEVSEEEINDHFFKISGADKEEGDKKATPAQIRQYFESYYPEMVQRTRNKLQNDRLFDHLLEKVTLVDKEYVEGEELGSGDE